MVGMLITKRNKIRVMSHVAIAGYDGDVAEVIDMQVNERYTKEGSRGLKRTNMGKNEVICRERERERQRERQRGRQRGRNRDKTRKGKKKRAQWRKNNSTGIGFLLNPLLPELAALTSLPESLTVEQLPLLFTPGPATVITGEPLLTSLAFFAGIALAPAGDFFTSTFFTFTSIFKFSFSALFFGLPNTNPPCINGLINPALALSLLPCPFRGENSLNLELPLFSPFSFKSPLFLTA